MMSKKLYTPYKEKPLKVRQFISKFDFPNPDWTFLPEGFPDVDKVGLTKEEGHILDGIKLAWIVSVNRRKNLYKSVTRKALVGITAVILIFLAMNLLIKPEFLANSVEAKTVGEAIGEAVEATMSAVFNK